MFLPLSLAATVTPSGDPTLKPGLDPASVTPGTLGFLATLFVVVLVIFLIRDMVKRIRRVRYAAEVEQARAQRAAGGTPAGADNGRGGSQGLPQGLPQRRDGAGDGGRPLPGGKHGPDAH